MEHIGEFFTEEVNKVISESYRENETYQKLLEDYFREELKSERLRVIIGFKEILDSEIEKYGDILKKFKTTDSIIMETKKDLLEAILKLSSVRFIELDHPVGLIRPMEGEGKNGGSKDWNMQLIGAPHAWDMNAEGRGIKLGIIDTGIDYNHPCLKDNVKGGYNFDNDTKDPFDDNGHGTHCAGIAAAYPSSAENLRGVATGADLYALKVLSASGGGRTSSIVAAIDWAVTNGLQVLSMSLGSRFPATAMHEALTAAHERGLILVAASGNEVIGPSFPAFYSATVSVGAVDKNKNPASFTNRDPRVNIAAPGVSVYSTIPGGKFAAYSGTSMACPHVSGVFTAIIGERNMTNTEAENLLYDTTEDIKRHSWEVGRGLVRIDNALKRL